MRRMRPTRKNSFLILELVIALFLIVTCLFPLLKPNIALYRLERKRVANSKNYLHERLLLCQVKEDLFESKYSFEQLKGGIQAEDYSIDCLKKTERTALGREGLLLSVNTAYGSHKIFVEKTL